MISDEQKDLISSGAEGKLSESDRRRLDKLIAQNEDARALYQELSVMNDALGQVGSVAPPEEIRTQIMSYVEAHPRNQSSRESAFSKTFTALIGSFMNPGRVVIFAGGVTLGIAIFALLDTENIPTGSNDNLSGSMLRETAPPAAVPAVPAVAQEVTRATLSLENARGSFEIVAEKSEISLSVVLDTRYEFEIFVTFESAANSVFDLSAWNCENPGVIAVNSVSGSSRFSGAGAASFVARFISSGEALSAAIIRVVVGGESKEIRLPIASQD